MQETRTCVGGGKGRATGLQESHCSLGGRGKSRSRPQFDADRGKKKKKEGKRCITYVYLSQRGGREVSA